MSIYLAKALVSRSGGTTSIRFIPLEIFDLWKSHMQRAHDYQVKAITVSIWIAAGEKGAAGSPKLSSEHESVCEVTLHKKVGSADMPVKRYFAKEDLERVLPTFLAHYGIDPSDKLALTNVGLVDGLFMHPDDIFDDEV